jgi:calcium binding protein 39
MASFMSSLLSGATSSKPCPGKTAYENLLLALINPTLAPSNLNTAAAAPDAPPKDDSGASETTATSSSESSDPTTTAAAAAIPGSELVYDVDAIASSIKSIKQIFFESDENPDDSADKKKERSNSLGNNATPPTGASSAASPATSNTSDASPLQTLTAELLMRPLTLSQLQRDTYEKLIAAQEEVQKRVHDEIVAGQLSQSEKGMTATTIDAAALREHLESRTPPLPFPDPSRDRPLSGAFALLIPLLPHLPFECRKDAASVFSHLLRVSVANFSQHVEDNYDSIIPPLIYLHSLPSTALSCGSMVRECIRRPSLYTRLLNSTPTMWLFFDVYVHLPNFDVASDAFSTVRELLTRDRGIAGKFLTERYEMFLRKYRKLLGSSNYITRRLSLKLLGELLLDRSNFQVMMNFISDRENLKTMMILLRDPSGNIQFEAFHVFKVFVANPRKPAEIVKILFQNKVKLVAYLTGFHKEREEDKQFRDEKALVVRTLEGLAMPE